MVDNQLTALMAYYAYLIIGLDLDSFSPLGGTEILQRCMQLTTYADNLGFTGWKAFENSRNRFALINDYLDEAMKPFRQLQYDYYRTGLDEMATNAEEAQRQATLYRVDQTYWQVVSLEHKQRLAESYLQLVKKFDADVTKMVGEGVATRSDALSVGVKVNEAEIALTKVSDGLSLSKMLLGQICGLPVNEQIDVADESREDTYYIMSVSTISFELRPELKLLQNTVDISRQATRLMRATGLPQVMLTGGYTVTNPNTFNGFERKFGGFWNVGLLVRIPVWNWGDVRYKVRASKGLTAIRQLELDETREKIELQVNQCTYRTEEAQKRLRLAQSSIERAEENLRTANLGFAEGVITPTTVMEAQTAWLQAQSERVDAEIEVRMAQTDLEKSLGTLGNNQ